MEYPFPEEEKVRRVLRELRTRERSQEIENDIRTLERVLEDPSFRKHLTSPTPQIVTEEEPPTTKPSATALAPKKLAQTPTPNTERLRSEIESTLKAQLASNQRLIIAEIDPSLGAILLETAEARPRLIVVGPQDIKQKSGGAVRIGDRWLAVAAPHHILHPQDSECSRGSAESCCSTLTQLRAEWSGIASRSVRAGVTVAVAALRESTPMVLSGEWTQVEVVRLEVLQGGLGFGIVGGTSTGVVVKTILPGSPADKDQRLRPGDHILQVGSVNTQGMTSQQVATILRQQENIVEMIVGRPIVGTDRPDDTANCWTMSTKAALNPSTLEEEMRERRHTNETINVVQNEHDENKESTSANGFITKEDKENRRDSKEKTENALERQSTKTSQDVEASTSNAPSAQESRRSSLATKNQSDPTTSQSPIISLKALQEMALTVFLRENWEKAERFDLVEVLLERHPTLGLGITVAGYVHRKEEIGGVFVKSLVKGSAAAKSKLVHQNDLILKVNGESLEHLSHADSVKTLVKSGQKVTLSLVRFHPESPQALCLTMLQKQETETQVIDVQSSDPDLVAQWKEKIAGDVEIIQAVIRPDKRHPVGDGGLGIALEGTVDVVEGAALCPHHYIGSIRRDGPAAGLLHAGDELLQVNHVHVYGESHVTVRDALSRAVAANAPVTLVVARKTETISMWMPSAEAPLGSLPLSYPLLASASQQIAKAKSDLCLPSCSREPDDAQEQDQWSQKGQRMRARSLEPLAGLAVWECVPLMVWLHKDTKGLGFSVADYKDPRHPSSSVVVVQSLVPGGVAQADGRIVPGDRLLSVNQHDLSCASLERAVAVLKAAPMGPVRLCIAKPVPIDERRSLANGGWPVLTRAERHLAKSASPTRGRQLSRSIHSSEETVWLTSADQYRALHPQGYFPSRTPSAAHSGRSSISGSMASMASWSPCSSRSVSPASPMRLAGSWAYDVIYLPAHLERTAKIQKGALPLGITVDAERDKGVNGCVVRSICGKKAIARDARIQVGDYIVKINHETLRNTTSAQARQILKRTNLVGTTCSIVYITGADAKIWKERFGKEVEPQTPEMNRLSPRVFPKFYRTTLMERKASMESQPDVSTAVSITETSEIDSIANDNDILRLTKLLEEILEELLGEIIESALREASLQLDILSKTPDWSTASSVPLHPQQTPETIKRVERESLFRRDSEPPSFKASPIESPEEKKRDLVSGSPVEISFLESPSSEIVQRVVDSVLEAAWNDTIREVEEENRQKEAQLVQKRISPTTSGEEADAETQSESKEAKSKKDEEMMRREIPQQHYETSPIIQRVPLEARTPSAGSETQARVALMRSKLWGEARTVTLNREPDKSFGISIVGGRVEVSQKGGLPGTGNTVSGIFIKSVLPNSPAGVSGQINMGDRVLSVNLVDLREASHEEAVAAIKSAENPVKFVLQSLHSFAPHQQMISSTSSSTIGSIRIENIQRTHEAQIETISTQHDISVIEEKGVDKNDNGKDRGHISVITEKRAIRRQATIESKKSLQSHVSDHSIHSAHSASLRSIQVDVNPITPSTSVQDKIFFVPGSFEKEDVTVEGIDDESAAALKRSTKDNEPLSTYGYTQGKIDLKYASLPGEALFFQLRGIPEAGLGLCLADSTDTLPHGVLVISAHPACPLPIRAADELLEVNGKVLIGLSPTSASGYIREATENDYIELIVLRRYQNEKIDGETSNEIPSTLNGKAESPKEEGKVEKEKEMTVRFEDEGRKGDANRRGSTSPRHADRMKPPTESTSLAPQVSDARKKSIAIERTIQIETGKETLIEIDKDGKGLGLSIVGGADTVLGTVVIHEVYPDGAAAIDGRLRPGDQVLEVNGVTLRGVTHERAISLLRRTPAKVRLQVYRDANLQISLLDPTQIYNIFEVELVKKQGRGLGLSIVGRKNEPGVYVSEVVKGGAADADRRLFTGDQILAVNGTDVANLMQEEVAAMLKACVGKVTIKLGRWKITEAADRVHAAAEAARATITSTTPRDESASSTAAGTPTDGKRMDREGTLSPLVEEPSSSGTSHQVNTIPTPKRIGGIDEWKTEFGAGRNGNGHITEGSDTLLLELKKQVDQQLGMGIGKRSRGILVTSLQPGSAAAEKLKVGDRILAVNALPVTDQLSAVTFVKNSGERLFLQIGRPHQNPHS
ncbi:unnamed protein product, partial [Mesorhabditis belari]|uniref:PDZ domain-containing protein n=1 Tax=Mesorhabditis belari TaxID=2138241 RepID=A0AAF3EZ82_9BILA